MGKKLAKHMTTAEAAAHVRMSMSWLEKRRADGTGPPWHRVPGTRRIYYDQAELDAWMNGQGRPGANRDGAGHGLTWSDMADLQPLKIEQESPE